MLTSLSDSWMAAFYPAIASGVFILADVGCRFYCQYLAKAKWYADTAAILVGILGLETNISQDRTQKSSVGETQLRTLSSFISFTMPCQNAKFAASRRSVIRKPGTSELGCLHIAGLRPACIPSHLWLRYMSSREDHCSGRGKAGIEKGIGNPFERSTAKTL